MANYSTRWWTTVNNQASHRNRRFQVPSGYTAQRIATEKRSSNGQIQTDCVSSTTRNCQNHSTVQYGRRDTTGNSSLYLQTFRICVRSMFWIQSPAHSTALSVWLSIQLLWHNLLHSEGALTWGKLNGTISQRILMKLSKKLNQSQKTTIDS